MEATITQPKPTGALRPKLTLADGTALRILIAEDNAVSRRVLESTLRLYGVEVLAASDGAEACAILQGPEPPPLVILDLEMPMMNGLEICQWMRTMPSLKYTYIMLLTAKDGTDDLIAGLQAGANDYLTKPYNRAELWARIQVGRRVLDLQRELARGICPSCGASYQCC